MDKNPKFKKFQILNPNTSLNTKPNTINNPFLVQKSKMMSMLAAVKSEEDIKAIWFRFLPSISDQISQASDSESDSNVMGY